MFSNGIVVFSVLVCALFLTVHCDDVAGEGTIDEVKPEEEKRQCAPWSQWQTSKCLWPTMDFSYIPKACVALPNATRVPQVLQYYAQMKQLELFDIVQWLFVVRKISGPCGHCSRKIRCRARENGQWQKACRFREVQLVNEECEGSEPCIIDPILTACPPPVPLIRPHHHKTHSSGQEQDAFQTLDNMDFLGNEDISNGYLDEDRPKNESLGPAYWNCVRDQGGMRCFCCCGWYFPDVINGKCVRVKPKDYDWNPEDEEHSWNIWGGLFELGDGNPYNAVVAQLMSTINNAPLKYSRGP